MCRQWQLLAGSAEASLSAGKCWLTWQQPLPPEGPVLRHVHKCKLVLCTDKLYLVNFSWPQLPALTAVHIEAKVTTTRGLACPVYWNNKTVRDLFVTVLRTKEHCLAHAHVDFNILALGVASSCLATLSVRAIVAETGLLAYSSHRLSYPVGFYIDLQLTSTPQLRQLLVCCQRVRVSGGQTVASPDWDCPALRSSGLRAAFFTNFFGVKYLQEILSGPLPVNCSEHSCKTCSSCVKCLGLMTSRAGSRAVCSLPLTVSPCSSCSCTLKPAAIPEECALLTSCVFSGICNRSKIYTQMFDSMHLVSLVGTLMAGCASEGHCTVATGPGRAAAGRYGLPERLLHGHGRVLGSTAALASGSSASWLSCARGNGCMELQPCCNAAAL